MGPDAMILVFWMLSFKPAGFPDSSVGTKSTCNAGDPSSIPRLGRSAGEVKKLPSPVIWPRELVHGVSSQKVRQDWATFTFIEASLIAQLVNNEWVMLSKHRDSFIEPISNIQIKWRCSGNGYKNTMDTRDHTRSLKKWSQVKSLSRVRLFVTPWIVAYQASSMGFSRQEYWGGLPFSSPEDLPNPGIKPGSPSL